MRIFNCKTNHLTEPMGFMMDKPVFSWEIDEANGKKVTESRIQLFEEDMLILDTGYSAEIDRLGFEADIQLKSRTAYCWTVSVRSDAGEEAESGKNRFETGKHGENWQASWISAEETGRLPVFHKLIAPKKQLLKARMYICGLGLYEAEIDGAKVGNEYLTPYCNNYAAWQQVITCDITDMLKKNSESKLSVTVADGWYAGRFGFNSRPGHKGYYGIDKRLLCEVWFSYADGSEECVPTDESWCITRSKYTFSDIYDGERRDDTLPETAPEKVIVLDDSTEIGRAHV